LRAHGLFCHDRGFNFGYSAWINAQFLGSSQGTNQYSAGGGVDHTNDTWSFDAVDLNEGDNVLTVVLDPTGKPCTAAAPAGFTDMLPQAWRKTTIARMYSR
jgi:hypothetical protein